MTNPLKDEMVRQSQNMGPAVFSCARCKNYKGALSCGKGLFIAFEGANLYGCQFFEAGKRCQHCGRIT